MTIRKLLVSTLLASLVSQALAADLLRYGNAELPDAAQVAAILGEEAGAAPSTQLRAIRLFDAAGAAAPRITQPDVAARAATEAVAQATRATYSAFSLPLNFDVASHRIDAAMAAQLDAVAEGIHRAPAGTRILIEGHTDASGDAGYNRSLSLRRAGMVKAYLVQHHGVDAERLTAVGMGESRPLEGMDPYAGANRRVEFRALRA